MRFFLFLTLCLCRTVFSTENQRESCAAQAERIFVRPDLFHTPSFLRDHAERATKTNKLEQKAYAFAALVHLSSVDWNKPRSTESQTILDDFVMAPGKALKSNSILTTPYHVQASSTSLTFCCREAEQRFWNQVVSPPKKGASQPFVAVSVQGIPGIVGAVKVAPDGDTTFLATKTVINSQDQATLIAGGIYEVAPKHLKEILNSKPPISQKTYGHVLLESLEVLPRRFFSPLSETFPDSLIQETIGRGRVGREAFNRIQHRAMMKLFYKHLQDFEAKTEEELGMW